MSHLQVGDRVSRQITVGQPERRMGVIVEMYRGRQSNVNAGDVLFAVRFDDTGVIERGFLGYGLQKEERETT